MSQFEFFSSSVRLSGGSLTKGVVGVAADGAAARAGLATPVVRPYSHEIVRVLFSECQPDERLSPAVLIVVGALDAGATAWPEIARMSQSYAADSQWHFFPSLRLRAHLPGVMDDTISCNAPLTRAKRCSERAIEGVWRCAEHAWPSTGVFLAKSCTSIGCQRSAADDRALCGVHLFQELSERRLPLPALSEQSIATFGRPSPPRDEEWTAVPVLVLPNVMAFTDASRDAVSFLQAKFGFVNFVVAKSPDVATAWVAHAFGRIAGVANPRTRAAKHESHAQQRRPPQPAPVPPPPGPLLMVTSVAGKRVSPPRAPQLQHDGPAPAVGRPHKLKVTVFIGPSWGAIYDSCCLALEKQCHFSLLPWCPRCCGTLDELLRDRKGNTNVGIVVPSDVDRLDLARRVISALHEGGWADASVRLVDDGGEVQSAFRMYWPNAAWPPGCTHLRDAVEVAETFAGVGSGAVTEPPSSMPGFAPPIPARLLCPTKCASRALIIDGSDTHDVPTFLLWAATWLEGCSAAATGHRSALPPVVVVVFSDLLSLSQRVDAIGRAAIPVGVGCRGTIEIFTAYAASRRASPAADDAPLTKWLAMLATLMYRLGVNLDQSAVMCRDGSPLERHASTAGIFRIKMISEGTVPEAGRGAAQLEAVDRAARSVSFPARKPLLELFRASNIRFREGISHTTAAAAAAAAEGSADGSLGQAEAEGARSMRAAMHQLIHQGALPRVVYDLEAAFAVSDEIAAPAGAYHVTLALTVAMGGGADQGWIDDVKLWQVGSQFERDSLSFAKQHKALVTAWSHTLLPRNAAVRLRGEFRNGPDAFVMDMEAELATGSVRSSTCSCPQATRPAPGGALVYVCRHATTLWLTVRDACRGNPQPAIDPVPAAAAPGTNAGSGDGFILAAGLGSR